MPKGRRRDEPVSAYVAMRIATWERESKLSLGQLARQAGVARSLLNQVRAGETGIASGSIEGFARTFGFESGLAMRIEAARWWETAEAAEYRTRVAQRLGALTSPFAGHTELEAATHGKEFSPLVVRQAQELARGLPAHLSRDEWADYLEVLEREHRRMMRTARVSPRAHSAPPPSEEPQRPDSSVRPSVHPPRSAPPEIERAGSRARLRVARV